MNPYQSPILMVDSVVMQLANDALQVLLIKRANQPFQGMYALPGGYIVAGETTVSSHERILSGKAGIEKQLLRLVEQLYTFDTVAGDPRGHGVSVTYMGLGLDIIPTLGNETQQPEFFPINALPQLAYDHAEIIAYAHERLKSKVNYTNAVYALLPVYFTLTQLQSAYEAILCRPLDKRNFRKKFLSLDLIRETNEYQRDGAHRPARLFCFNAARLERSPRSFD
jgi:8-oxo-dGTP diphosphatase